MNRHGGLPVFEGGEFLRTRDRQRAVARNEFFGQAAHGFHAQGQWNYVEQQPVVVRCAIAREQIRLHCRAERDYLIGVKVVQHGAGHMCGNGALDIEHARCAAHHDHALQIGAGEFRLRERFVQHADGFVHQMFAHFKKLRLTEHQVDHMTVG